MHTVDLKPHSLPNLNKVNSRDPDVPYTQYIPSHIQNPTSIELIPEILMFDAHRHPKPKPKPKMNPITEPPEFIDNYKNENIIPPG